MTSPRRLTNLQYGLAHKPHQLVHEKQIIPPRWNVQEGLQVAEAKSLFRAGHLSALEAQFTNLLQQNKVRSDMGMLMEDIIA